jgi:hypothetical protein
MQWFSTFILSLSICALTLAVKEPSPRSCTSAGIPYPELFGGEILSLSASTVTNFSSPLPQIDSHFAVNITGLEFCNVTIQYTQPGQNTPSIFMYGFL